MRIIYADDSPDDRELVRDVIERCVPDFELVEFENGAQLISSLHADDHGTSSAAPEMPDLILLDLHMPVKNGIETLREIKSHPRFKQIPVVMFTREGGAEEITRSFGLHANAYIQKPGGSNELDVFMRALAAIWGGQRQEPTRPVEEDEEDDKARFAYKPASLLLLEDDDDDAVMASEVLLGSSLVNAVFVVRNTTEFFEYLAGSGSYADRLEFPLPDLILLDLILQGESGIDVVAQIQEMPALANIPVMILTGVQDEGLHQQALDAGAVAVINKPLTFDALVSILGQIGGLYFSFVKVSPR